ncbi:Cys-tRNA(Pro) deacylase [Bordetella holmesii]|uniref:Cys-tRNA(Pro)/Cys-tRNA(Cys) deacylase n=2 Tax=Bordetella holmesii TaxID=35814 RepID=A0A158M152_9BORD|nr:Cys-tRNA(Pro) deacylase [Bordetella holmesii]AHV94300.1 ybaK / prolyl-tRNA synthetases associated domain protein [Bordetella holmesii ATCC 51541]AIT27716.1 ybaK / prolyl-tRNA synthetases associated domain protein [Bordetella holmesii 44057]EWM40490.1 ybaK / prolyl-tRNA synthetases associated domain protein [Bordetella holmesii 35009]EWM43914.1 ybaK / prolyl-tRNA synthetases associated domain protein [Bordetella holmesii 41130]EWM49291.1 ybaK / prolyl-tRNA synthetases associated domain prote
MSKSRHVSETPATQLLKQHNVAFTEHTYDYVDHGGAGEAARQLGLDPHAVVKTLVMEDEAARPLVVIMHGDREVSTKNLARQAGLKKVSPCQPDVAQRHSGYQVGGTSPFGTRKRMPVYVEESILAYPEVYINGGRRGYLVGIAPQVLVALLDAKTVSVGLE